jgi:predicted dithiol-disulfide oxidoreductase (DUF899 family)
VFVRRNGHIRHWWSSELFWASQRDGEESRHVDFMWPYWNILDCTPEGRPKENTPRLQYPCPDGERDPKHAVVAWPPLRGG